MYFGTPGIGAILAHGAWMKHKAKMGREIWRHEHHITQIQSGGPASSLNYTNAPLQELSRFPNDALWDQWVDTGSVIILPCSQMKHSLIPSCHYGATRLRTALLVGLGFSARRRQQQANRDDRGLKAALDAVCWFS
ncbi:hypothetical protein B0H34DRAFT_710521 [Crassisporium funariophilum]|nr:hypothetical protein B0H34DRAFT_739496 [Crassisporium funariophilum]KAF8156765.1 hypothetical protein B0H34DRAFT_710477 [Crassisporium funariophilum]KAF8156773.1 hypothetical protein B0H34DRAFT_710521 [Crassisporium funariophilum]